MDGLAAGLLSCGLTLNQARVYVYLVLKGASPVIAISRDLGLHRVEVYRKLKDLDGAGLLETYLDDPKRYAAVEPSVASTLLLRRQEERLSVFGEQLRAVISRRDTARTAVGLPGEAAWLQGEVIWRCAWRG
ncbi:MAG: hypothetical protein JRN55_04020, partial [Nitrososphaerota archaeon]|nr:hypothetical protein [Nitrososphaerota archaeon]